MKATYLLCICLLTLSACDPATIVPAVAPVPLIIHQTNTPRTASANSLVTIGFTATGSDLCHSLDQILVQPSGSNRLQVHALWLPAKDPKTLICLQAIYNKDSSATHRFPAAGQYFVDFMRGTTVIETDTITIN